MTKSDSYEEAATIVHINLLSSNAVLNGNNTDTTRMVYEFQIPPTLSAIDTNKYTYCKVFIKSLFVPKECKAQAEGSANFSVTDYPFFRVYLKGQNLPNSIDSLNFGDGVGAAASNLIGVFPNDRTGDPAVLYMTQPGNVRDNGVFVNNCIINSGSRLVIELTGSQGEPLRITNTAGDAPEGVPFNIALEIQVVRNPNT